MDTKALKAEIQLTVGSDGRPHYGKSLRAKLIEAVHFLRTTGATQLKIAETLGLSQMTVGRYLRGQIAQQQPRGAVAGAPRPVAVSGGLASTKVTTPSGFEVEGLGVEDIAALIRVLS